MHNQNEVLFGDIWIAFCCPLASQYVQFEFFMCDDVYLQAGAGPGGLNLDVQLQVCACFLIRRF